MLSTVIDMGCLNLVGEKDKETQKDNQYKQCCGSRGCFKKSKVNLIIL